MSTELGERENKRLKLLYKRTFLSSFGSGFISPFIPIYAAQLSASPTEIGLVQAINNVSPGIAQIPWGFIIDKVRRRVIFLSLGGLFFASILLLLPLVNTITEFIITILLAYFLSAMAVPALNSLIGDFSTNYGRGKIIANLNAMVSLGSIPATILSGFIIYEVGGAVREMYRIPLALCFIFHLAASITALKIEEKRFSIEAFSARDWVKALGSNPFFRRFCLLSVLQGFSLGLPWSLFTLTVVKVVEADMFQISLLSVVSSSTAVVMRRFTGRLADRAGRKPLIVLSRTGLFLIPLVYALARSIYDLILGNFISGIIVAASDVALSAYLLDISPRNMRGSYTSLYNAVSGLFTFIGSTFGGYLLDSLIAAGFSFYNSMTIAYTIAIIIRIVSGALYITIKEPYKYPAKFEDELKQIFKEEVEVIERRISDYRRIEDEDLEWFERLSEMGSRG
jgi:MFS family permease